MWKKGRTCTRCKKYKRFAFFGFIKKENHVAKCIPRTICKKCCAIAARALNKKRSYTDEQKQKRYETLKRVLLRYPQKTLARRAMRTAVDKGTLVVSKQCFDCQEPLAKRNGRRTLVGDHYLGYEKKNWLKIQWICRKCDGVRRRKYD